MEVRIGRSLSNGLLKSSNGIWVFFLTDFDVGLQFELIDAEGLTGLLQLGHRSVILALLDQEVEHVRSGFLILRFHAEIGAISLQSLRLFLGVQAEGKT